MKISFEITREHKDLQKKVDLMESWMQEMAGCINRLYSEFEYHNHGNIRVKLAKEYEHSDVVEKMEPVKESLEKHEAKKLKRV